MTEVCDFLQCLFESGVEYSGVNTARSALSAFLFHDEKTIGKHPIVCRLMKGFLNKKPPLPRYTATWDINIVLDYLKSKKQFPLSQLSLKELGERLAILLAITTGKRGQNLNLLDTNFMVQRGDTYRFDIRVPVKNYRDQSDVLLQQLEIKPYPPNPKLCPVKTLEAYLARTEKIRKSSALFVISKEPYTGASRATISRWVKTSMANAGVDIGVYKPHSTRHASVSKAHQMGIPTEVILSRAGWKSDCCFAKYYLKPIQNANQDAQSDFQSAVLSV